MTWYPAICDRKVASKLPFPHKRSCSHHLIGHHQLFDGTYVNSLQGLEDMAKKEAVEEAKSVTLLEQTERRAQVLHHCIIEDTIELAKMGALWCGKAKTYTPAVPNFVLESYLKERKEEPLFDVRYGKDDGDDACVKVVYKPRNERSVDK